MARRRSRPSFSLFAFQDIVTAVTGILMLITITLTVLLITTPVTHDSESREDYHSELIAAVDELRVKASTLERNIGDISELTEEIDFSMDIDDLMQARGRLSQRQVQLEELSQSFEVVAAARDEQSSRDEVTVRQIKREMNDASKEIAEVQSEMSRLKASNSLLFNPPKGLTKKPLLIEIDKRGIAVAPVSDLSKARYYRTVADFLSALDDFSVANDHFVLIVHPGGVGKYDGISEALAHKGFDFGFDAIEHGRFVPKGKR